MLLRISVILRAATQELGIKLQTLQFFVVSSWMKWKASTYKNPNCRYAGLGADNANHSKRACCAQTIAQRQSGTTTPTSPQPPAPLPLRLRYRVLVVFWYLGSGRRRARATTLARGVPPFELGRSFQVSSKLPHPPFTLSLR